MKLSPLMERHVFRRDPYYVRCRRCGRRVYGESREEVIRKATGWVGDDLGDTILCRDCAIRYGENRL